MGARSGGAGMRLVFEDVGYGYFAWATEAPLDLVFEARA